MIGRAVFMGSYYSISAFSTIRMQYNDPNVIFIEPGDNVFVVLTTDIDAFVEILKSDGIRVDAVNKLDGPDAYG
jgi:hypothetical protein